MTTSKTGSSKKSTALHLDISVRHLNRLIAEGTLPPMPGGGFDLNEVRPLFIRHLRKIAAGREGAGLAEARASLARLRGEKVELEVRILKHRYVAQEEIARQLEGQYAIVNDRLHCVAPLAAERIGGDEQERSRNRQAINEEIYLALSELRKPADLVLAALAAQEEQ